MAGFYGLPLTDDQTDTFKAITGRTETPAEAHDELWLAVGRRGGKSHVAALVAVYEAAFRDHRDKLSPGEWATVMLIAGDRMQARTLLRYVRGLFEHPMLKPPVLRETANGLELDNRCAIEVATASFKSVRGYTLAAVIADEIAFWMTEGVSPDVEVIAALRPALATLGGKLIALSSPYAKRGALWITYQGHFGRDSRVLVAQAPSQTMNPTLLDRVIDDAMAEDPARAAAEYLAQFRADISSLIDPGLIEDARRPKPLVLPRTSGAIYGAFVDPAGGGQDEFTLCIAYPEGRRRDGSRVVVDAVFGRNGSPARIVEEYARILQSYGIRRVTGDRYAGRWPRDEFGRHGISYDVSDQDRSALYGELLSALSSGRVELPPDQKLARQLIGLERRTGRSGRDIIDHPPGAHDDLANAVAGAVAIIDQNTFRKVPAITGISMF
ncbi:hypothetical protein [Ovoidimarina sediminis]|uniref:hypothetical protein n=1 Tax=Ovoidimarina sediminis TaxID=3079856 RepID=UPI00290C874A|nr:hypothetical protein [Rhodophyticola sp. MJ-SS7]MDU8946643.1 hypothetical protein [Rhodophyticola sp. MJ-SS7]